MKSMSHSLYDFKNNSTTNSTLVIHHCQLKSHMQILNSCCKRTYMFVIVLLVDVSKEHAVNGSLLKKRSENKLVC